MTLMNLPQIPQELKSISSYIQRAEELKPKDPVMAYWCAYYAAQLGVGLKLKDAAARNFLFDLLGVLEQMKAEVGSNDAIDDEAASSAYVENFALKVFSMADNEDRKGNATRATAKKFLAAANFLEVLSVFASAASNSSAQASTTINVPEKIRYAKWKAADIAKAFREGRKPTPGAADETQPALETEPIVASQDIPTIIEPGLSSPPALRRSTSPPGQLTNLPSPYEFTPISSPVIPPSTTDVHYSLPQGVANPQAGLASPAAWSTVATPGSPGESPLTPHTGRTPEPGPRRAWVSREREGVPSDQEDEGVPDDLVNDIGNVPAIPSPADSEGSTGMKTVRFTPSVTGGLTPSADGNIENPFGGHLPKDKSHNFSDSKPSDHPAGFVPTSFSPSTPSAPPLPLGFIPTSITPSPPTLPPPPLPVSSTTPLVAPLPVLNYPVATSQPQATITQTPPELTPQMIARIQKHCKFAISSLDYDDAEQARKELRAALQMLGG